MQEHSPTTKKTIETIIIIIIIIIIISTAPLDFLTYDSVSLVSRHFNFLTVAALIGSRERRFA